MPGLCPNLLGQACRIFLSLAYPEGENSIPVTKRAYLDICFERPLEPLLKPPVCQVLPRRTELGTPVIGIRGYAFRLGSSVFPHLKLQVVGQSDDELVFSVDMTYHVSDPAIHSDAP